MPGLAETKSPRGRFRFNVNIGSVLFLLGRLLLTLALALLIPALVGQYLNEDARWSFYVAAGIAGALGLFLERYFHESDEFDFGRREAFVLVSSAWLVGTIVGALPYVLENGIAFAVNALFESASGFTTTGASIFTDVESLPGAVLLWRALTQWIGGMGIIVLGIAILPKLAVGGMELLGAEAPGPMQEKLTPRIAQTAKGLWAVYAALTVLCALAYWAAGMSALDAVIHAFTTLPLGGYSSHDASFAFFDSAALETVAVLFMLIAGVNFGTHFLAFRGRSLAPYRKDPEVLAFFLILLASCWGIAAYLRLTGAYPDLLTAARYATFNVVSIATTTGYASTDYNQWPIFAPLWMLTLCAFASCSGSTGGGIKMIRAQLLWLHAARVLKALIHPRAHLVVKLRERRVENHVINGMLAFIVVFGGTTLAATMLLTATGMDFLSASTAAVASITNTGPGLGTVGPAGNYASLTDLQKWVCTAAMLLGRLELFTLLVVFTPAFWRR